MKPLQYVEMEPADDVADIAMTYWGFAVHALPHPNFVHRVWPDGCVTLALSFLKAECVVSVVVGARTTALDVPVSPGDQYWGIRFRPEAGGAFCGRAATALRDGRVEATSIFGDEVRSLATRLLTTTNADVAREIFDEWIRRVRAPSTAIDPIASAAVRLIVADNGAGSMQAVADTLQVTARQLQRRFRGSTGLTPKEFAIIRRARATLTRLADGEHVRFRGGWAQLAATAGFADQAHLTREFTRLLRLTPTGVANRIDEIGHENLQD